VVKHWHLAYLGPEPTIHVIYLFEKSFLHFSHKVRHFASSIRLRLSYYSESGSVGNFGPGPQRRVFQPDSFPSCLHSVASIPIPVQVTISHPCSSTARQETSPSTGENS